MILFDLLSTGYPSVVTKFHILHANSNGLGLDFFLPFFVIFFTLFSVVEFFLFM